MVSTYPDKKLVASWRSYRVKILKRGRRGDEVVEDCREAKSDVDRVELTKISFGVWLRIGWRGFLAGSGPVLSCCAASPVGRSRVGRLVRLKEESRCCGLLNLPLTMCRPGDRTRHEMSCKSPRQENKKIK